MSGTDWEKDPELQALRREFVQSFAGRAQALRGALAGAVDVKRIEEIAHKLAGSARSYGFAEIGDLAEQVEDLAEAGGDERLSSLVSLLCELLETSQLGF